MIPVCSALNVTSGILLTRVKCPSHYLNNGGNEICKMPGQVFPYTKKTCTMNSGTAYFPF